MRYYLFVFLMVLLFLITPSFSQCASGECEYSSNCYSSGTCLDLGNGSTWYCNSSRWLSFCPLKVLSITSGQECDPIGPICNTSDVCISDSDCRTSFYCNNFAHLCTACPSSPESPGYFNGYCPSPNCIGIDPDCCNTDGDCSLAESIDKLHRYYCFKEAHLCRSCSPSQDFVCPSPNCIGIDPDCCNTDGDCVPGFFCNDGTCMPKENNTFCFEDSDCPYAHICVDHECVLACSSSASFLSVDPRIVETRLGSEVSLIVRITNPRAREDAFVIYLLGNGFVSEFRNKTVSLDPFESESFPIVLYFPSSGSYTVEVNTYSLTDSKISCSIPVSVKVIARNPETTYAPINIKWDAFTMIMFFIYGAFILSWKLTWTSAENLLRKQER